MHFIPLVMGKFCTNMLKTLGLSLRKPKMQRIEITALKRSPEIAGKNQVFSLWHRNMGESERGTYPHLWGRDDIAHRGRDSAFRVLEESGKGKGWYGIKNKLVCLCH